MQCPVCGSTQNLMFEYQNHMYYRCVNCKLVSTHPFPDEATIRAHYARKFKSGNYQLLRDYSEEYKKQVYSAFVKVLENRLTPFNEQLEEKNVLDVGCFTGEFLELLHEKGASIYGLELQPEAVEIASRKFPGRVYPADINSNDFPQMKFDVITLLGVIEHVIDPVKLLGRSAELLHNGGMVLIQTPNSTSVFARTMKSLWPPYAPIEHIHLFSRESLTLLLTKLRFTDITFIQHWKKLPVRYVYEMMQNYGPEFRRLFQPVFSRLPVRATQLSLPFYVGEMIITARKG